MQGRRVTAAAVVELASAQAVHDSAAAPIVELEREVLSLDAEHADVAVAVARATDERDAAASEVVACEAAVAEHAGALREEADDDPTELDPAAAERAEREIVRLERRISALGPVNALAPEQHEALEARVLTFGGHREDLVQACTELRAIARRLEREIEQRFDTVFGVSFHFQELYAELFPGGKATLRLEEPAPATLDLDGEAVGAEERRPGVEILAQPAKRLTPLRLLSGGERALTALAVVLALQQVNPSPFYVFDEVDASLDDSNVLRFTRLLRRLGSTQQFLVVTHNHITMAAADALWGVTIDGDGVSSVLGVRFDEAEITGAPRRSPFEGLRMTRLGSRPRYASRRDRRPGPAERLVAAHVGTDGGGVERLQRRASRASRHRVARPTTPSSTTCSRCSSAPIAASSCPSGSSRRCGTGSATRRSPMRRRRSPPSRPRSSR